MLDVVNASIRTVAAEGGEVLNVFGGRMVVKTDPAVLGVFLAEHVVPPGYCVPPHIHAEDDEAFYILEGELTLIGDAGEQRIGPGATAELPARSRHGFRNDTGAPVRFLVALRPGLQGIEMFRHFDRSGRLTRGVLAPAEIAAICAEYGVALG